jgi:amino acid transporter
VVSLVFGWILLIGVTAAIQPGTYASSASAVVPPAQIFVNALGKTGGILLMAIVIVAQFYCGMASVTSNSRMIYAFSRDGAVPGSQLWRKINPRTRTPTNSVWLAAAAAFILGLPYLWSATAYAAVTSIAVIGLYIAYVTPVYLKLRAGDRFQQGKWNLGRWSKPLGWIAVAWVILIVILFGLPTVSPVSATNFNYSIVAVAVVLFGAGGWYMLSAHKWFTGPRVQGSVEELAAVEHELSEVEAAMEGRT